VVEQHAHRHSALHCRLEGVEERSRGVVERQNVELDVHPLRGTVDRLGHRLERGFVVVHQCGAVAAGEGHRAEMAIEGDDGVKRGMFVGFIFRALGRLANEGVDLGLLSTAALGETPAPQKEEQRHTDVRGQQKDDEQPGRRCLRPSVTRNVDEAQQADDEVDDAAREDHDR
jgi:hypothetical protein